MWRVKQVLGQTSFSDCTLLNNKNTFYDDLDIHPQVFIPFKFLQRSLFSQQYVVMVLSSCPNSKKFA
jgi:hypothetical protein